MGQAIVLANNPGNVQKNPLYQTAAWRRWRQILYPEGAYLEAHGRLKVLITGLVALLIVGVKGATCKHKDLASWLQGPT